MALYTYDGDTDVLYVLLVDEVEAAVNRTLALNDRVHVDLDADGEVVGIEVLYARREGVDLTPFTERYGVAIDVPFAFAA